MEIWLGHGVFLFFVQLIYMPIKKTGPKEISWSVKCSPHKNKYLSLHPCKAWEGGMHL